MICPNCATENPLLGLSTYIHATNVVQLHTHGCADVNIRLDTLWCNTCSTIVYIDNNRQLQDKFTLTLDEKDISSKYNTKGTYFTQTHDHTNKKTTTFDELTDANADFLSLIQNMNK